MLEGVLFPDEASTVAGRVDHLYIFLLSVTAFFSVLIFSLVFVFAIRYRRRDDSEVPRPLRGNLGLEILWSVVPLVIVMVSFAWGASVFFEIKRVPEGTRNVFVTGKQWMWIIQHPEGKREVNQLHVPVGQPVKLTMISEDVIHDFFIPAFRVKMDVLPGRYTTMWFEPTRVGRYHLFCAEYCGTKHSQMIGEVVVMSPVDFENWLTGGEASLTLAERGQKLFGRLACHTCHSVPQYPAQPGARGPPLIGVFGSEVSLKGGERVRADEAYLRESILDPQARVVDGYEPVMPTYRGQISEEQLLQVLAYIKSLSPENPETTQQP